MKEQFKCFIFDLDGTLIDTEKLWIDLSQKVAQEMNIDLPYSFIHDSIGRRSKETEEELQKMLGLNVSNQFFEKFNNMNIQYIEKNGMPLKKGAIELLDFVKQNGYISALVSSSYKQKILHYINLSQIETRHFDKIISGDMVKNAKPHPEIYLQTLDKLNLKPQECIIIEDSNVGVEAGYKAGVRVIFIQDIKPLTDRTRPMIYAQAENLLEVIEMLK